PPATSRGSLSIAGRGAEAAEEGCPPASNCKEMEITSFAPSGQNSRAPLPPAQLRAPGRALSLSRYRPAVIFRGVRWGNADCVIEVAPLNVSQETKLVLR